MTFNAAIPLNSDSPGVFPAQSQTNFGRLQTIISADHQFNLSAAANDGYHTLVRLIPQAPSGALTGFGRVYSKSVSGIVQLFYMDDAGTEYQITPTASVNSVIIRAAVNFNGTGAVGAQVIRSSTNVTSVVKNGTGDYTINFTSAMPNNNYIVSATGMRNSSDDISNGQVRGTGTYGSSVATTAMRVQFNGGTSSLQDVLMGNILVVSIT